MLHNADLEIKFRLLCKINKQNRQNAKAREIEALQKPVFTHLDQILTGFIEIPLYNHEKMFSNVIRLLVRRYNLFGFLVNVKFDLHVKNERQWIVQIYCSQK